MKVLVLYLNTFLIIATYLYLYSSILPSTCMYLSTFKYCKRCNLYTVSVNEFDEVVVFNFYSTFYNLCNHKQLVNWNSGIYNKNNAVI